MLHHVNYLEKSNKVLLTYTPKRFEDIISQISKEDLDTLRIEVYPSGTGHLDNILTSRKTGDAFEKLAAKAAIMLFEGPLRVLHKIGVR